MNVGTSNVSLYTFFVVALCLSNVMNGTLALVAFIFERILPPLQLFRRLLQNANSEFAPINQSACCKANFQV